MTRQEFLEGLRKALGNDLQGAVIQENVDYYDGYIRGEMRKGRPEHEVTAELGDPWVIAKTIIGSEGAQAPGAGYEEGCGYENSQNAYGSAQGRTVQVRAQGRMPWWKRILVLLAILGIVMILTTVIGGILSVVVSIAMPFIMVLLIVRILARIFNSRR